MNAVKMTQVAGVVALAVHRQGSAVEACDVPMVQGRKDGGNAVGSFSYTQKSDIGYWAGSHCGRLKRHRRCSGGLAFLARNGRGAVKS